MCTKYHGRVYVFPVRVMLFSTCIAMEIPKHTVSIRSVFTLLVVCALAKSFENTERSHDKIVVCYVGTYASTREGRGSFTIDNVDPSLCTHVVFAFVHIRHDTTIYVLDSWYTFIGDNSRFQWLKIKYPDVKFMVSVGGWYDGTRIFSALAQNADQRKSFAMNVVKFLRNHGFDGADICWLYPSKRSGFLSDKKNFVALLKELNTQLHEENYLLTTFLGGSVEAIDNGYDMKGISENVDLMIAMCYDYNGWWSRVIGPLSPFVSSDKWNVNFSTTYMLRSGASPEKLVLGIPSYGRFFIATNETMAKGRHVTFGDKFEKEGERRKTFIGPYTQDESGIIGYGEICLELLNKGKWTRYWDKNSSTPYIVHEDKLISYDDAESTAIKVKFALEQHLTGVMVYGQDLDDFMGDCYAEGDIINAQHRTYPLLRAINDQLRKYSEEILPTTMSTNVNNTINYTSRFVKSCAAGTDVRDAVVFFVVLIAFGIG